jgi:aerotaxis receptor
MRINLPVTQQNFDYSGDELLVSSTNTKGEITHCNPAFVRVSGYSYDELIGQPHNLIRHPDMPAEAYKDMWRTIGRGEPWTGLVKNRRKNGDHYWVRANAVPVVRGGRQVGYMSVRTKPSREKPLTAMNASLAQVTRLCVSVVDINVTSSGSSNSRWVMGSLIRIQASFINGKNAESR